MNRRSSWLPWLLLVTATAVLGGGAFLLLVRESRRVESLYGEASEARGRTIAENASLIAAEVRGGVSDSLAALPEDRLGGELTRWRAENRFVAEVFLVDPSGRWLLPDGPDRTMLREALRGTDGRWPWEPAAIATANELAVANEGVAAPAPALEANYAGVDRQRSQLRQEVQAPFVQEKSLGATASRRAVDTLTREAAGPAAGPFPAAAPAPSLHEEGDVERGAAGGWVTRRLDGHPAWLGWHRAGSGAAIRGVVLDGDALAAPLAAAFPARVGEGEAFVLRDAAGRVVHAVPLGYQPGSAPATVRLAPGPELPGWWLEVHAPGGGGFGRTFLLLAGVIVALLSAALLAGGTLLLRQARRDALEAARKTTFVANVSHELKTPLTSIRLFAELLAGDRVNDAAKRRRYLETIATETQRLARLVNNVLDFSRLERGRRTYRPEPIDLGVWLERWLELQEPRIVAAGIRLQRVPGTAPRRVLIEPDALEQVLLNLVDNALKYAAAGGELVIGLREAPPPGGAVELVIADRGPGVPPEHRERIFELFHRVDDSLTAEHGGCGLGLAIARRLLRDQGGDLTYEPNEPAGARFVARLPVATAP